jgi:hypothetical protein
MFDYDPDGSLNRILDKIGALFDRRNEIAHSVLIGDPKNQKRFRFQDVRAKLKLGEMPQAQIRTPRELNKYARDLLKHCAALEHMLTRSGVLTVAQLHANEIAILLSASHTVPPPGEPQPAPTKHRTRRGRAASKPRRR